MTDARVQSAIDHWAPRFVANGVPLTDFQEVTAGLERWDEWCAAWCARAALHEELGRSALAFDGPGQGEGEYEFAIRGDYESAVKAVIDSIERRQDLDASRIGLWGVSLGGYYAPRAAAFERRVRACVALSGPYDLGDAWRSLPDLTRETFRVRSKRRTEQEACEYAATLSLKGIAGRITCPLFIVAGELDRIVPCRDAERLAREVGGPVELLVVEGGNHVANNRAYRYRPQTADWMARQLSVAAH